MLSPLEAIGFKKCVTSAFDNLEFVLNWERLRKRQLRDRKSMELFITDVRCLVWDRLSVSDRLEICNRNL